jgi:hypothetical protein
VAAAAPLTQMALALGQRDSQFNKRFKDAYLLLATNPSAALPELEWAAQEHSAIEQQRNELDIALDKMRTMAGIELTPQDISMGEMRDRTSPETGLQIACGQATALLELNRREEARKVVDAAVASLRTDSSPDARKMLLQMRASLLAADVGGL